MFSIFDSTVVVNADSSALTLVYKGNHAGLVIESVRQDNPNEKEIRFAHFLPKSIDRTNTSIGNISNLLREFTAEPREASVEMRTLYPNINARAACRELGLTHYDSNSFEIRDIQAITNLISVIRQEMDGQAQIPRFQIRGMYVNQDQALNCVSWVRRKFQIVGVELDTNLIDRIYSDNNNNYYRSSYYPSSCIIN